MASEEKQNDWVVDQLIDLYHGSISFFKWLFHALVSLFEWTIDLLVSFFHWSVDAAIISYHWIVNAAISTYNFVLTASPGDYIDQLINFYYWIVAIHAEARSFVLDIIWSIVLVILGIWLALTIIYLIYDWIMDKIRY